MSEVYEDTGVKTFEAENDLSTYQYRLVEQGTSHGQVDLPDADTDIPIGVLLDEPSAGDNAAVKLINAQGTCYMVASAVITEGDLVVPAAVATAANRGKIRTLPAVAATYYIVGKALNSATADGQVIEVMLMPAIQRVVV